jgi:hypothetical protein
VRTNQRLQHTRSSLASLPLVPNTHSTQRQADTRCFRGNLPAKWPPNRYDSCCERGYIDLSIRIVLGGVEHLEDEKRKPRASKYGAMAAEAKAEFFPFVIESSGGWGAKATEFVDAVIKAAADSHAAWCPHEVVHGIVRLIGVAVQRGNAWMAEGALPQRLRARVDRRLD